jgi:hypothetical protein
MSTGERNYDEESSEILELARKTNFLVQASYTAYSDVADPVVYAPHWVSTSTSGEEAEDANT